MLTFVLQTRLKDEAKKAIGQLQLRTIKQGDKVIITDIYNYYCIMLQNVTCKILVQKILIIWDNVDHNYPCICIQNVLYCIRCNLDGLLLKLNYRHKNVHLNIYLNGHKRYKHCVPNAIINPDITL